MKRAIIGTVLSFIMFAFPALGQDQNPSHQSLETFYNSYLTTVNKAFDHPTSESIERFYEFYSPKLIVHQFMPPSLGGTVTLNRDEWKNLMFQVHLNVKETLHTNQLVIDPVTKQIAAQQTVEFSDYETGETIASIDDMVIYSLEYEEGRLKIVGLKLMFSDPGVLPSPPSE